MNNFSESLEFCKTIFHFDNAINVASMLPCHIIVIYLKYFIFECLMTDIRVYIFSQVYMFPQWGLALLTYIYTVPAW